MLSSLGGGRYTSRSSARLSAAVAILMYMPRLISENITRWSAIHDKPEAFGSRFWGVPAGMGTIHVS